MFSVNEIRTIVGQNTMAVLIAEAELQGRAIELSSITEGKGGVQWLHNKVNQVMDITGFDSAGLYIEITGLPIPVPAHMWEEDQHIVIKGLAYRVMNVYEQWT